MNTENRSFTKANWIIPNSLLFPIPSTGRDVIIVSSRLYDVGKPSLLVSCNSSVETQRQSFCPLRSTSQAACKPVHDSSIYRVAPGIASPGLPQIRACGITAHGSSKHCYCVLVFPYTHPVTLFATFSLTRLQMSVHPPCFAIASQCFDDSLPFIDSS